MSSQQDSFNNIIQCFKEFKFLDSDSDCFDGPVHEEMSHLYPKSRENEAAIASGIVSPSAFLGSPKRTDNRRKVKVKKRDAKQAQHDQFINDMIDSGKNSKFDTGKHSPMMPALNFNQNFDAFSMSELLPYLEMQKSIRENSNNSTLENTKLEIQEDENINEIPHTNNDDVAEDHEPAIYKKVCTSGLKLETNMMNNTTKELQNILTSIEQQQNISESESSQKNEYGSGNNTPDIVINGSPIESEKEVTAKPALSAVPAVSSSPLTKRKNPSRQDAEPTHILFANPANLFYKKMGNERHYYIGQIANGSAGVFLEKPEWDISHKKIDLSELKEKIYTKAKKVANLVFEGKITIADLNSKTIDGLLVDNPTPTNQMTDKIETEITNIKGTFGDYIAKSIYGKRQHSYKIPNAEELQKLLIIPKNYSVKDHVPRIFLRMCLRIFFEQFFSNQELYDSLVEKIIEHVQEEVDKKKKDTAEKLPQLKSIFYKTNRKEFSQKFLEPPQILKNVKANFKYFLPDDQIQKLFMDFWSMIIRLQDFEGNGIPTHAQPKTLFYSNMDTSRDLKGGNLWMAVPFKDQDSLKKTQNFLGKKEIPTFSASVEMNQNELFTNQEQQPQIQIWNSEGTLASKLTFEEQSGNNESLDIEESHMSNFLDTQNIKLQENLNLLLKGVKLGTQ